MAIVDSTGARNVQLSEIISDLQSDFRDAFGEDIALEDETPLGQIIGIWSSKLSEGCQAIVSVSNGMSASRAVGVQLDDIGSLTGVRRGESTHSTVTATLTGVDGTNIPEGSRTRTAAGDQFETLEDAVLATGGVDVEMQAVEDGPVVAGVNALNAIVTIIQGWETVTNDSAAVVGVAGEGDPKYRRGYRDRTAKTSQGNSDAITAGVIEAGADDAINEENDGSAIKEVQGYDLPQNTVIVVSRGGTDAAVSEAVLRYKGMGVGAMTAIYGGTHETLVQLQARNNASITFSGEDFDGLDFTGAADLAAIADIIQTAVQANADAKIAETQVAYIGGSFVFVYRYQDNYSPEVTGTNAVQLGFSAALTTDSPGPFIRTRERDLTIDVAVSVQDGFPSNGRTQIIDAIKERVGQYGIGEQVWSNDILVVVESIAGTRVTTLTVEDDSVSVAISDVPLETIWTITDANLTVTLTI